MARLRVMTRLAKREQRKRIAVRPKSGVGIDDWNAPFTDDSQSVVALGVSKRPKAPGEALPIWQVHELDNASPALGTPFRLCQDLTKALEIRPLEISYYLPLMRFGSAQE